MHWIASLLLIVSAFLATQFLTHNNIPAGLFFSVLTISGAAGLMKYQLSKGKALLSAWTTLKLCFLVGTFVSVLLVSLGSFKNQKTSNLDELGASVFRL